MASPTGQSTSQMGLRQATFSDLPSACLMLAQAFKDEPLFGDFIHPYRYKHPLDPALWWLKRFRMSFYRPGEVFLITSDKGNVTGLAKWSRAGPNEELRRLGWAAPWWDPRHVLRILALTYALVCSWFHPNRVVVPERENIFHDSEHFMKHHWSGSRESHWFLDILGVHPDYQNKGIGRALVAWGMTQARKEGVACSVVSAEGKDNFYQSCGFDELVGSAGDGDGNPLAAVSGGSIWFRDL